MAPVKVGIVGYGGGAKNFHIPYIKAVPDLEIIAFLQRAEAPQDPSSAPAGSHCTVDFPGIRHYRTAEEFFADPDTQLIVVVTRTDTHIPFAEMALNAGKHAIVDKPFARSSEEADHAIQLAESKGLILTCYQNRRWDGDFVTVRNLIKENALGKIMEAEIHYDFEWAPWLKSMTAKEYTPGDGMAFGLGSHSLDWAVTLFGRPASVTGFYRVQRGIESEVEDSFTIVLQYGGEQKELLVTVKTSMASPMAQQLKYMVRGAEGSYLKMQERSLCAQEDSHFSGMKPTDPGFGEESKAVWGTLTTYKEFDPKIQTYDEASKKFTGKYPTTPGRWTGIYQNVAQAVQGKAEVEVKPTQSRDVLRLLELARESHNTGKTVPWR